MDSIILVVNDISSYHWPAISIFSDSDTILDSTQRF